MTEPRFYVYSLTDPRHGDQPFYIGKGTGRRCFEHLRKSTKNYNPFKTRIINAIRKAGFEPGVKILFDKLTEEMALEKESKLILQYGRRSIDMCGILTNRVVSGTGGRGHSPETRAKMSEYRKGRPSNHTPEGRANRRRILSERNRSPEEIQNMIARCLDNAKKLKGKPWPEARRKAYEERLKRNAQAGGR